MTENDKKVLAALAETGEDWCLPFYPICRETKLDRKIVRISCRRLARNGLAKYHKGLWTDEGTPAGAGYAITRAGAAAIANTE